MIDPFEAFRNVDFNPVSATDDIWSDDPARAYEVNAALADEVAAEFFRLTQTKAAKTASALTQVLVGNAGAGKTRFMSGLRRRVVKGGGWFVFFDIVGLNDFWANAALSFVTSLLRDYKGGLKQFQYVLILIAAKLGALEANAGAVERLLSASNADIQGSVERLLTKLNGLDSSRTKQHQDVFRALWHLLSDDMRTSSAAYAWLQGMDPGEEERRGIGILRPPPVPAELVRGMTWIMSLVGPVMIAFDQIDALVNPSGYGSDAVQVDGKQLVGLLTAGLIEMHNACVRSMAVITCIPPTWDAIYEKCTVPERHRFSQKIRALRSCTAQDAKMLIGERLAEAYADLKFSPPYPSWPFTPEIFAKAAGLSPRLILMRCENHRLACLEAGKVFECSELPVAHDVVSQAPLGPKLDEMFAREKLAALPAGLPEDEARMAALINEALNLLARQQGKTGQVSLAVRNEGKLNNPPLHGRFVATYIDAGEREDHFCFRAIEQTNAVAVVARLRAAITASSVGGPPKRRELMIIRNAPFSAGAKTQSLVETLLALGGRVAPVSEGDIRTILAAARVAADYPGEADEWLARRRPMDAVTFIRESGVLDVTEAAPGAAGPGRAPAPALPAAPAPKPSKPGKSAGTGDAIPVGRMASGEIKSIRLADLPRHVAILAGSGSGKTVLLRRIVEEAALAGIPSIVLDPNNDLSRLGTPWPSRPAEFTEEDEAKARAYAKTAEVVIWTPGISAGRPLTLPLFPDFSATASDPDATEQAVAMAFETVAPHAGVKPDTVKAGILMDAIRHIARQGGATLGRLAEILADIPDGMTVITTAAKEGPKMANMLHAAMSQNPMLKSDGATTTPGELYRARETGRTRVSVISLAGLSSAAARQDFVNQLQMALFGWIKENPSATGRLYVIDEAQIFLPSGDRPSSRGSAVALASQARKYGLGMILATQLPKGIDHGAISSCTTQFFGKMGSPAAADAVKEMIAARGGSATDIGSLKTGMFYFFTEGSARPQKITTSLCLTRHGGEPPSRDQVVAMARR